MTIEGDGQGDGGKTGGEGDGGGALEFPEFSKFIESLPDDLKKNPSLQTIKTFPDMAKSFVNAQSMIGKDKIIVPNQYSTPDEWKGVFSKLGLPENLEKYGLNAPEGKEVNADFLARFKEKAFENNVLPNQAQALFDWYNEFSDGVVKTQSEASQTQKTEALDALKKEWGEGFDKQLHTADMALGEFAEPEQLKYMKETGLNKDPQIVKLFAKIGASMLKEGTFKGETVGHLGKTKEEVKSEIDMIMGDLKHPYNDRLHPNHKTAVANMSKLFTQLN